MDNDPDHTSKALAKSLDDTNKVKGTSGDFKLKRILGQNWKGICKQWSQLWDWLCEERWAKIPASWWVLMEDYQRRLTQVKQPKGKTTNYWDLKL